MGVKKVKTNEKVYYSSTSCTECGDSYGSYCRDCLEDLSGNFYYDFRKIAPKADKILIVAYNSNWQGKTGYLVMDFNDGLLQNILNKTTSFSKKVYKEGKNMCILATSHDVPTGGKWLLKPICSRGMRDNDIIQKAIKVYG